MNYQKIYNQIVDRGKVRILEGYSERHHIIPKCMGGNDEESNLVELTAREHFICHWLLYRMYPNDSKIAFGFVMMCKTNNTNGRNYIVSSRVYEEAKLAFSEHMAALPRTYEWKTNMSNGHRGKKLSENHKKKIGNSNRNKKKPPRTIEHLDNISKALKGLSRGKLSINHRLRISNTLTGYVKSQKHLDNISKALMGRNVSDETKEKIRQINIGKKLSDETKEKIRQGNVGKKLSEETKEKLRKPKPTGFSEKLSKARMGVKTGPLQRIKCPHCNVDVGINNANRYHFDNCKNKEKL